VGALASVRLLNPQISILCHDLFPTRFCQARERAAKEAERLIADERAARVRAERDAVRQAAEKERAAKERARQAAATARLLAEKAAEEERQRALKNQ
jgi:hypothetical protein